MRKIVLAATAVAALAAVPASAEVFNWGDPAAGDGSEAAAVPAYGGRAAVPSYANHTPALGYADKCRTVRERVVTPQGHVVFRTHQVCP